MKYIKYLPAVLWMALIFFLSSRSDLPGVSNYFWEFLFKKSGHLFVYFVLTLIWLYTLTKNKVVNSIVYTFAYAFTDEIHQLFVPGRTGMLRDVYIDLIGVTAAVLLFNSLNLWKKKPSLLALTTKLKR